MSKNVDRDVLWEKILECVAEKLEIGADYPRLQKVEEMLDNTADALSSEICHGPRYLVINPSEDMKTQCGVEIFPDADFNPVELLIMSWDDLQGCDVESTQFFSSDAWDTIRDGMVWAVELVPRYFYPDWDGFSTTHEEGSWVPYDGVPDDDDLEKENYRQADDGSWEEYVENDEPFYDNSTSDYLKILFPRTHADIFR